jgi:hypothetical protein
LYTIRLIIWYPSSSPFFNWAIFANSKYILVSVGTEINILYLSAVRIKEESNPELNWENLSWEWGYCCVRGRASPASPDLERPSRPPPGCCYPEKTDFGFILTRGSQRDVVYICWPIAASYTSPICGGGGLRGLSQWVQLYTSRDMEPKETLEIYLHI